ncbi:sterol desaturase family protein [Flavobacterium sedimenticola]|uniref:Sterol desaturase family protein n=1 Tax=Flavobacterium sedimenticola TaxID=3043286 RepID=A0ABT6XP13_9FLAO|nr:sterol desaturase family protein [Flavobacterium sedimenticola]MDI9256717.1 sterol desaturase family protein [Flavobacterium sedimenticola]
MEQYGKILLIAMPFFLLLIVIEKAYGYFKGIDHAPMMDSISSISSGMTNAVKDALGLSIAIISYEWMESHWAIWHIQNSLMTYAIAFIVIDFYGYWSHRWAHQINLFWNKHAIHHSSEEFNLACALRQPISSFINLFTFLLLPAAILGVPSTVIAITLPIHLFLQFWYHTRYIGKLGFLEKIIVTPSHHRVHHAINPEYMDKNHGQIFIVWDKLFGTFQEEKEDVPAVFGITRPAHTWNPIKINFQHLWLLLKDAYRAENWKDKLTIWFKPTGWRPEGFDEKYPVEKINDVYHFKKYDKPYSKILLYWALIQLFSTLGLISYLFGNIAVIGLPHIFVYGLFVFITIYSYTELMDTQKFSLLWETIRFSLAIAILFYYGDWFGLNRFYSFASMILVSYFCLSLLMSFYFVTIEFNALKTQKIR